MNCFICKTPLTLNSLSKHFRLIHSLNEKETYLCTFDNCNQYLNSLGNLKRHLKMHLQRSTLNCGEVTASTSGSLFTPQNNLSTSQEDADLFTVPHSSDSSVSLNSPLSTLPFSQDNISSCANNGILFALELHNKNNFARKDVTSIQENVLHKIVNPILEKFDQFVKNNFSLQIEQTLLLSSLFQEIENPFRNCSTDHQLYEWLKANDYLSNFEEFSINNEITQLYRRGEMRYDEVDTTGVLMPISFQFRKIFEKNDLILHTLKNMEKISNNSHLNSNFIQNPLWKEKSKSLVAAGKIAIPYFLYIDDAEINNPLGSHCNPISFLYYSFPVIENCEIFSAAFFQSKDYKEFGNEKCLRALIREIIKLEQDGLKIVTSDGVMDVYFVLGLVLGDNLGFNTVLGFVSSFSANYFCRFCKELKLSTHTACSENPKLLRNIENYNEDVCIADFSTTGIKENSLFNLIDSFHITTNYAVDVMHDIFEGVCHYNMCHIIQKFIEKKYFDLDQLNYRKLSFNYGEIEIGNISPAITKTNLLGFHLKMTAREMMTFVHLFTLMVGDLVPENDEVWVFLKLFLEIIEILLSFEIPRDLAERLKFLIKRHHTDYVKLFNDTLKPKHHLMVHYYSIILQSDPPRNNWSFRYEATHKDSKSYARVITSRKNICVSLAKKFQLKFAHSLIHPISTKYFKVQQCHIICSTQTELIDSFCNRNKINSKYFSYTECTYKCKKFKRGFFISQFADAHIEDTIIFEIAEIFIVDDHETPYVVCKRAKINAYLAHFLAYDICRSSTVLESEETQYLILPISSFTGPPINSHQTVRGLHLIRPKHYF